jgi:hypothetical protein
LVWEATKKKMLKILKNAPPDALNAAMLASERSAALANAQADLTSEIYSGRVQSAVELAALREELAARRHDLADQRGLTAGAHLERRQVSRQLIAATALGRIEVCPRIECIISSFCVWLYICLCLCCQMSRQLSTAWKN